MKERVRTVKMYCECGRGGLHCPEDVVFFAAKERVQQKNLVVISDRCPHGPQPEDELWTWGERYAIYKRKNKPAPDFYRNRRRS